MSAAGGNRLREGQVFEGVLDIDPRPTDTDTDPEAEETYPYDEVPGVFTYATGEDLLAELDGAIDDESPGAEAVPATGQRHLSLWERMLEVLDMEFTRNLAGPDELSETGYPTPTNGRTDGEDGGARSGETDEPTGTDIDHDRETNGKTNTERKRTRAGLYATLGELAGAGKQGRHAR